MAMIILLLGNEERESGTSISVTIPGGDSQQWP